MNSAVRTVARFRPIGILDSYEFKASPARQGFITHLAT